MALSFSELRKQRKGALQKLTADVDKLSTKFNKEDDRFWQPTVDKAGNGYAVIRFLPPAKDDENYFVRIFDHGFKGPTGKWYIEQSRTTIGEDDPVSEMNSELWAQGEGSAGRRFVSGDNANNQPGSKRRTSFISNIYVVEDPDNPENNGKVFLFKYGKKIFDKLNDAMNPKYKDETPINPYDLWEGANFKLKIRKVEGQRNYDKSEFDDKSIGPIEGKTDTDLEKIWEMEYPLGQFLAPDKFKAYDELKKKLDQVMDRKGTAATRAASKDEPEEEIKPRRAEEPKEEKRDEPDSPAAEDDDESLEFFKRLT